MFFLCFCVYVAFVYIGETCFTFGFGYLTHWGRDKKFVPKGSIDNISALVQILAWRRPGNKPMSEPMLVNLLMHICVTRPQWVKILPHGKQGFVIPPEQRSCWGVYWFHSVRPCPSVRASRLPCPLCNIYSSGWILSILATNDHYHERVCRTQWPLTLTYIFKVIRPWLRKSCPLCSVYSYG